MPNRIARHLSIALVAACLGVTWAAPTRDTGLARLKEPEPLVAGAAAEVLQKRTYDVVAAGTHAFAATTAGLTVYDISDYTKPAIVTSLYFPGSANGIAISGDRVILAMGPEGLRVIDVSDPAKPRLTGSLDTDGSVNAVALAGSGRAAIADGPAGIKVVDIDAAGVPKVVSSLDTKRYAVHVAVNGDLVAAAEEDGGVGLYRLGKGGALTQASSSPLPGTARGVAFSGTRCFVAAGLSGLLVLDVANPAKPKMIGSFPSKHYARGVFVQEGVISLADSQGGLMLIEEGSDGERPAHRLLSRVETGSSANRVRSGTLALVAIDSGGIRLVDVSDPANPQ